MTVGLVACGRPDPRALEYAAPIPVPDPAEPLDPTAGVRLWSRAADGAVVQAVPPPRPETVDVLRSFAARPLATQRRIVAARSLASDLDPEDLIRALVHPERGSVPARQLPYAVFQWQQAVCFLLGGLDPHVLWFSSRRRAYLRAVLFSHPDWTTAAALLALLEVALDEPEAAEELRVWLPWLVRQAPRQGHCPWATAVAQVYRVLPGLPPDLLQPIAGWLSETEGT